MYMRAANDCQSVAPCRQPSGIFNKQNNHTGNRQGLADPVPQPRSIIQAHMALLGVNQHE